MTEGHEKGLNLRNPTNLLKRLDKKGYILISSKYCAARTFTLTEKNYDIQRRMENQETEAG